MADDGDARDDGLSGLLEVEPLDEVTRRRLVTTAVRASAPPAHRSGTGPARSGSRRIVAAAAMGGIVIAAGIGYLVSRDGDNTSPTASREPSALTAPTDEASGSAKGPASASPASSAPASPQSQRGVADTAASPPRDAGDYGDLRVAANVQRLQAALAQSAFAATSTVAPSSDRVAALLAQLRTQPCAGELPIGTVIAVATGRFGSRDAIVVQTELPNGARSIDAIVVNPCKVRPLN